MKILIIQTAFIGDVILATSTVDLAKKYWPDCEIHFLLRKGNESIMNNHPNIHKVWIWDKAGGKYRNLFRLGKKLKQEKFDYVFNIQRFFNSGLLTWLSKGKVSVGFDKNPLSFLFSKKVKHLIPYPHQQKHLHEVQRNAMLLGAVKDDFELPAAKEIPPSIHPTEAQWTKIHKIVPAKTEYVVLAPASVWFTKQWAKEKWIELTKRLSNQFHLYFIGGPGDKEFAQEIIGQSDNCHNLCGELGLVESAALMKDAKRVFVNDSAPLHLGSGVNANITAIFCSTVPEYGYTPLTDDFKVIQLEPRLECMPCGLHGKKECPFGHFKCALDISIDHVIETVKLESVYKLD
jgi:lipopolysaccharide heptosyltransferase II